MLAPLRRPRKLTLRTSLLILVSLITLIDTVSYHRWSIDPRIGEATQETRGQKIYVASTHWNNEAILREHWNAAVVALVERIGVENIYISVYESGSSDDSKGALQDLDDRLAILGVNRTIILDKTTHQDAISQPPGPSGWIDTPRNARELRRIPYLAHLRNLSLQPLSEMRESGVSFDKILFLNDVVFTVSDAISLLDTNFGNYAAACSLDFSNPPNYYDTFALRDSEGHETVMQTWPYFRSWESRKAVKQNRAVPVSSCWNGMVFMDANPFYDTNASDSGPLRFRGIADTLAQDHLEASECCLIHVDNPLSPLHGVWLNPNVRVGYNKQAYDVVNSHANYMGLLPFLRACWSNRMRRWLTTDWFKKLIVNNRLRKWEREGIARSESGSDCLINEMQVLVSNGWKHL